MVWGLGVIRAQGDQFEPNLGWDENVERPSKRALKSGCQLPEICQKKKGDTALGRRETRPGREGSGVRVKMGTKSPFWEKTREGRRGGLRVLKPSGRVDDTRHRPSQRRRASPRWAA